MSSAHTPPFYRIIDVIVQRSHPTLLSQCHKNRCVFYGSLSLLDIKVAIVVGERMIIGTLTDQHQWSYDRPVPKTMMEMRDQEKELHYIERRWNISVQRAIMVVPMGILTASLRACRSIA